jgi:hypothetical protein
MHAADVSYTFLLTCSYLYINCFYLRVAIRAFIFLLPHCILMGFGFVCHVQNRVLGQSGVWVKVIF